jgi:hypothetical protein
MVEILGADIGRPLWDCHFESAKLKHQLCRWWNEPVLEESVSREKRVAYLRLWAEYHEASSPVVCAKHPLLCLSALDLDEAWGGDYRAIRSFRPLEKSIEGLVRRGWYSNPTRMQRILYAESESYFSRKEHLRIDYGDLLDDPVGATRRIAEYLGLDCSDRKIGEAASIVRAPS